MPNVKPQIKEVHPLSFLSTILTVSFNKKKYQLTSTKTFAAWFNYDVSTIWRWVKKKVMPGFKYKKYIYIILPPSKVTPETLPEKIDLPNGKSQEINWNKITSNPKLPPFVSDVLRNFNRYVFSFTLNVPGGYGNGNNISGSVNAISPIETKLTNFIDPSNLHIFPSMIDYKYGYYIIYNPNRMSTFVPGTGTLKSTTQPSAFFELCRLLDAAENSRNGNNPGLPPQRNLSTTVSFDSGTISVAATIPVQQTIDTSGIPKIGVINYLGSTYSTFDNTGCELHSTNLIAAFLEMAGVLSAGEKSVTPTNAQPNNIQVSYDIEAGTATVAANLPFSTLGAANGDVTVHAIDYL